MFFFALLLLLWWVLNYQARTHTQCNFALIIVSLCMCVLFLYALLSLSAYKTNFFLVFSRVFMNIFDFICKYARVTRCVWEPYHIISVTYKPTCIHPTAFYSIFCSVFFPLLLFALFLLQRVDRMSPSRSHSLAAMCIQVAIFLSVFSKWSFCPLKIFSTSFSFHRYTCLFLTLSMQWFIANRAAQTKKN